MLFNPKSAFVMLFAVFFMAEFAVLAQDQANEVKTVERLLRGHSGPVHAVRFTPDGRQLVSASGWPGNDNSVRIWDLASGQQLHRIPAPGQVGSLILSADGKYALAGGLGAILYIEVVTGQVQKQFRGVNSSCASLEFSPDGKHFYSASLDGFARRWDLSEGKEVARYRVAGKWARFAGELPGQRLVSADEAGTLQIWDLATGTEIKRIPTGPAWLSSAAILPGGRQLLTGVQSVGLWDLESGEKTQTFQGHRGDLNALALAPDGKTLLTACNDGTARLWDIRDGSQLNVVLSQEEFLFAAAYSPDGRFMAIAGGGAKNGNDFVGGSAHDIHIIETGQLPIQVATPANVPTASPTSSSGAWLKIGSVILLLMTLAGIFLFGIWRRRAASAPKEKTPASLAFACSQCGHNLRVRPEVAGKKIKCPKCGTVSRAPVNC